jgi:hypothetical protein
LSNFKKAYFLEKSKIYIHLEKNCKTSRGIGAGKPSKRAKDVENGQSYIKTNEKCGKKNVESVTNE